MLQRGLAKVFPTWKTGTLTGGITSEEMVVMHYKRIHLLIQFRHSKYHNGWSLESVSLQCLVDGKWVGLQDESRPNSSAGSNKATRRETAGIEGTGT